MAAEDWFMQIEKIFIIFDVINHQKVPLVAFMFTSEVEH